MEEKIDPQPAMEPEAELPVPSFWENLKANKFKILGGILGVFVFAGAVFGAYKLGQRQVQPGPSPTPTPAVVATPTPDPTANWKTYTNTKYGYSIKYPTDWVLQPDKQTPDEIVNFGKDFYSISIYAGSASTGVPPGAVPSEISSVTIAGQEATREVYEGLKILVKFPEELEVNQIVMSVEYSETFNLMLSTFRFLEETERWQTLSNSVYKFSLKYPPNYQLKEWSPTTTVVYSVMLYDQKYESMLPQKPEIAVDVHKKDTPIFVSLDDFIQRDCREVKDLADVTIGGKMGKQFVCSDVGPVVTRAVVEDSDYVYSLSKVEFSGSDQTEVFNQILFTFRFLD